MASNKLQKKDYTRASLRAYFLQNGMNYSNYQGLGYANMLYPGLRKIYDDDDQLRDALKENVEFFNTNPSMVPFIGNLHLAMLDGGANAKEVKSIKMALMGPMAGIGDSLSQFCLAPLFATIGASLAQDGLILGPAIFFLGMNITLLIIKLLMGNWGHKLGASIIEKLSSYMEQISTIAGMIGTKISPSVLISLCTGFALEAATFFSSSLLLSETPAIRMNSSYTLLTIPVPRMICICPCAKKTPFTPSMFSTYSLSAFELSLITRRRRVAQ